MSPRGRYAALAALALLVIGAITVLRAPAPDRRPDEAPRGLAEPGEANMAILLLILIATPALALLCFAALRYRTRRPPSQRQRSDATWRTAAGALVVVLVIAAILAVISRAIAPERPADSEWRGGPALPTDPPENTTAPPADIPEGEGTDLHIELWALFVLAALLALGLVAAVTARRNDRAETTVDDFPTDVPAHQAQPLALAAERALSVVDQPASTPREAIIRCYAAMERALADTPDVRPHPADTPTEVLRRATDAGLVRDEHGSRLVALFTEARYSTHPMSEDDQRAAADTLRLILTDLRRRTAWVGS